MRRRRRRGGPKNKNKPLNFPSVSHLFLGLVFCCVGFSSFLHGIVSFFLFFFKSPTSKYRLISSSFASSYFLYGTENVYIVHTFCRLVSLRRVFVVSPLSIASWIQPKAGVRADQMSMTSTSCCTGEEYLLCHRGSPWCWWMEGHPLITHIVKMI